jgi:hypothetical protein
MEITLRIHESHPHERDPQIARLFTVIAGEDTEATSVNG